MWICSLEVASENLGFLLCPSFIFQHPTRAGPSGRERQVPAQVARTTRAGPSGDINGQMAKPITAELIFKLEE